MVGQKRCRYVIGLLWLGAWCALGAVDQSLTWRQRFETLKTPYIPQYSWVGGLNPQLTDELFREYLRMGFTGIQVNDLDNGSKRFLQNGMHGFMWQTYFNQPDPVITKDGKAPWPSVYGCLSSDNNIKAGIDALLAFIRANRANLFVVDGRCILSSWDETGLMHGSVFCQCEHCRKLFAFYVRTECYHDQTGDGSAALKQLNQDAGTGFTSWDELLLPQREDRFKDPVLWQYYMEFTSWKVARFFARVEEGVNKAGEPMAYVLFYHATMYWPGIGAQRGITPLQQVRTSAATMTEHCGADWPVQAMDYAWTDRLSREYGKAVMNWSWFWPGYQVDGADTKDFWVHPVGEYDRALARMIGHTVHGLCYWVYFLPVWNHLPQESMETAYWHHFLQKHWDFLKQGEPARPQIAVLFPGYAGGFYKTYEYPKPDYGWGPQALIESQYPFTIVQEEEVETGILKDYKALLVFSAERTSRKVVAAIDRFIEDGGYVLVDADSLLMDIEGQRTDLLERRFGIKPEKKYKSTFWPTVLSAEEDAWAQAIQDPKKLKAEVPPLPDLTPTGLKQEALAPEQIHVMDVDRRIVRSGSLRTYHDIVTGTAVADGKVLGTFRGEPAVVETEQTLWCGNRPGFDIYAVFPEKSLADWGEPLYGLQRAASLHAAQRTDYRRMITTLVEKAGIQRPVVVRYQGGEAPHVEVVTKKDPTTGGCMIFLINHDNLAGVHEVEIPDRPRGFFGVDVTANRRLKPNGAGRFEVELVPWFSRVLFVGPARQARQIERNQAQLLATDMKPVKFTIGPKTLKEPPLPIVAQASDPEPGAGLETGVVAQLTIAVRNTDSATPRVAEPVVLPADSFAFRVSGSLIRGVRLASGEPVQWDDLDGNGRLSPGDEIVWQVDLQPGEEMAFVLSLLDQPSRETSCAGFKVRPIAARTVFSVADQEVFAVGNDSSWEFPQAALDPAIRKRLAQQSGARFFMSGDVTNVQIKVVADGPVRKLVEMVHRYVPVAANDKQEPEARSVETRAIYAVYARPVPGEQRVYAHVEHRVEQTITMPTLTYIPYGQYTAGCLVRLGTPGWYKDTLGRVGPLTGECIERNSGGWVAMPYGTNAVLGLLARRTEGIVSGLTVPDETDGLQVNGGGFSRSFVHWEADGLRGLIDREIMAGNVYRLDCMLVMQAGQSWEGIDALRRQYSRPPTVCIQKWMVQ